MKKISLVIISILFSSVVLAAPRFTCSNHEHSTLERVLKTQIKNGAVNGLRGKRISEIYNLEQTKNCANGFEHYIKAKFYVETRVGQVETDYECQVHLSRLVKNEKPGRWTMMSSRCVEIHFGSDSYNKEDHHRDEGRSGNGPDSYDDGSDYSDFYH